MRVRVLRPDTQCVAHASLPLTVTEVSVPELLLRARVRLLTPQQRARWRGAALLLHKHEAPSDLGLACVRLAPRPWSQSHVLLEAPLTPRDTVRALRHALLPAPLRADRRVEERELERALRVLAPGAPTMQDAEQVPLVLTAILAATTPCLADVWPGKHSADITTTVLLLPQRSLL